MPEQCTRGSLYGFNWKLLLVRSLASSQLTLRYLEVLCNEVSRSVARDAVLQALIKTSRLVALRRWRITTPRVPRHVPRALR